MVSILRSALQILARVMDAVNCARALLRLQTTSSSIAFRGRELGQGILSSSKPALEDNTLAFTNSFIDILDDSLSYDHDNTARIFVIHQTCWMLWNQRYGHLYNHHLMRFSPWLNTNRAKEHLVAALRYNKSHKKNRRIRKTYLIITSVNEDAQGTKDSE